MIHLDFETRSTVDIKKCGAEVYARHPSTEVICMGFAFGDGPVELWHPYLDAEEHASIRGRLTVLILSGVEVVAHNAPFELAIWNHVFRNRLQLPALLPENTHCTMATAYAMALPDSLDNASAAMGIDQKKDMQGNRLMLQISKPREILPDGRVVWWEDLDKYDRVYDYCIQDVKVERELHKRLLALSASEREMWLLDYKINQRGIRIDLPAVEKAIAIVDLETERLNAAMRETTNNAVAMCTASGQLREWIESNGVACESVDKSSVLALLEKDLPPAVRKALLLRQEAAKSSTAKLEAMKLRACEDGRVRGVHQYHGASTGRWAGRGIQAQNLPRPKLPQHEIEQVFELFDACHYLSPRPKFQGILLSVPELADTIDLRYGPPLDVISSCLRGFLIPAPGCEFVGADFGQIEARVVAWLAGELEVLNLFHNKGKIYEVQAASVYNVPASAITKEDPRRQVGKVAILALGFGGGIGAFATMALGYNVDLRNLYDAVWPTATAEEKQAAQKAYASYKKRVASPLPPEEGMACDIVKQRWRKANPKIVRYWYAIEDAAISAVMHRGHEFKCGAVGCEVRFRVKGSFLFCRLPSGRVLTYPYPKIDKVTTPWGVLKDGLTIMGVDAKTNKWVRMKTYGGLLTENVVQAVARDLLAGGMKRLEPQGYPVVMHIHDEVLCEVPKGLLGPDKAVEKILTVVPEWAAGLPLAAEGFVGKRYQK